MNIKVYSDYPALSREAANVVAQYISRKPNALICLASGSTPVQLFHYLVEDVKAGRLKLDKTIFVALDEWVGIDRTSMGSCRNMMDRDLFVPAGVPESNIVFFDAMAKDPQRECDLINQYIASRGGLDIMLVGVGLNGHIAMNEPGVSFDLFAHVSELSEETKTVGQKYFSEQTALSKGLTLGLKHLAESKLPILMANGAKKATVIKAALTGPVSPAIPASIIQTLPQALILLDEEAAKLLPRLA